MSPGTLVKFNYEGDALDVVALADGDVGVALRPLCEDVFGVDFNGQRQRLARAAKAGARWATVCVMHTVGGDGKNRKMLVLPRTSIPMFAATIDASRVRANRRAKIVRYQNEAAEVLAAHFLPRGPAAPRDALAPAAPALTLDNVRDVLREELAARPAQALRSLPGNLGETLVAVIDQRVNLGIALALRSDLDPAVRAQIERDLLPAPGSVGGFIRRIAEYEREDERAARARPVLHLSRPRRLQYVPKKADGETYSETTRRTQQRIDRLEPACAEVLQREAAPMYVRRWVAWASDPADRQLRCDLALHLRALLGGTTWGIDQQRQAALDVYEEARKSTLPSKQGKIVAVADVPEAHYLRAMEEGKARAAERRDQTAAARLKKKRGAS